MYILRRSDHFDKQLKKLLKNNLVIAKRVKKALYLLAVNPFHPGLKSTIKGGDTYVKIFGSRVTGDIRIIWQFDSEENLIIILLNIGVHDKVYPVS